MFDSKQSRLSANKYVGNQYQIGGTRHYRLIDGNSKDCRCIDVRTGSGLEYTVVCDRGLDISLASFKGVNLVHLTEGMEANPAFCSSNGAEWLNTFSAGLLTTCGPSHLGDPCIDEGESLGQHGNWSSLSAKQVADLTDFEEGKIEITGQLYEGAPFGNKLKIRRTIKSEFGKSTIFIEDEIKNQGSKPTPLNVLYHVNFGYPFLDETSKIHIPSLNCVGYDEYSKERINERFSVKSPDGVNSEKNFLHTFDDSKENVTAWIHNENICDGVAVYLRFNPKQLPFMTQWMLEDIKDYVVAIEPANVPCESRNVLREKALLPVLEAGETCRFSLEIGIVSGNAEIKNHFSK